MGAYVGRGSLCLVVLVLLFSAVPLGLSAKMFRWPCLFLFLRGVGDRGNLGSQSVTLTRDTIKVQKASTWWSFCACNCIFSPARQVASVELQNATCIQHLIAKSAAVSRPRVMGHVGSLVEDKFQEHFLS